MGTIGPYQILDVRCGLPLVAAQVPVVRAGASDNGLEWAVIAVVAYGVLLLLYLIAR